MTPKPRRAAKRQKMPTRSKRSRDVLRHAHAGLYGPDQRSEMMSDVFRLLQKFAAPAEIMRDLSARSREGVRKYGTRLKSHNGRDARLDLYQELLDAFMYATQEMLEGEDGGPDPGALT
jgi:hypothetical protein